MPSLRRLDVSSSLVKALAAIPFGSVRLPTAVIESLFGLRRRAAGLSAKSTRIGRFEVPYLEGGSGDGAPVLFVHGFSDNKDSFVEVAQAVVDGHRVVLLDVPGFGSASAPLDFTYGLDVLADLLAEFCEALEIQQAHVVGSSLGGAIGTRLALDHPEAVRSLALVGAAGVAMPRPSALQRRLDMGDNPFVVDSFEAYETFMRFVLERVPPTPGPVRRFLADEFIGRASLNEKIMADLLEGNFDLTERLGELRVPTLVVWGDCDRLVDISAGRVYRDGIANSRMVVFHGIGHCPQYECPAQLGRYVRRFVEGVEHPVSGPNRSTTPPKLHAAIG